MDHFKKLQTQIIVRLFAAVFAVTVFVGLSLWAVQAAFDLPALLALAVCLVIGAIMSFCLSLIIAPVLLEPVRIIWQAILHVSPASYDVGPPNLDAVRIGRELITSLSMQVYQLARQETPAAATPDLTAHREQVAQATNIVSHLPLPMFVCNKQQLVTSASDAAIDYCSLDSSKLLGQPFFNSVKLEFGSEDTLEAWMKNCQADKVNDRAYWERVRIRANDDTLLRQCDMAAYYDRDNPSGTEFIITLFDRTDRYQQDDKAMSFVAMAVHELRTPLTVLRGYIEVFEEELTEKLDPELKNFMYKMQVSAEQLTGFVNNILNVSRVEDDQMVLSLNEEDWQKTLSRAVEDNNLRARVHGKNIVLNIAAGLPTVAVDRVSIYEVISNLLDNAIKYSAESKEIIVTSVLGKNGMVETTIKDFGVGIPTSVLPNLFEKFYRNHRTRTQIGGTGLGLYLCKSIVSAHGGQIWAESKEAGGSTFGFSLQPYAQVADELKNDQNKDITREAHGWVKNHSLYRR